MLVDVYLPLLMLSILQGINVLETAFRGSPSTLAMAEPFLFNLCTESCISPVWSH